MKYLINFLTATILIAFFGCNQKMENVAFKAADEEIVAPTEDKSIEVTERKLIKEGHVEFETNNIPSTRKNIFQAVEKYKGYVSSDQEYKSPGRKSNTLVVRVPANNFDNFLMDATRGVEKFESKEITVKDVTEEFLDVEARLKTKKELEARYLDLLKQARNVTEMLEIEKQLGELRSEIESIEGRLKYLQNQVSYSTLTITFYEIIPNETEFGQKFKIGFRNGWDNLIWFFVILTNIWPFVLIGITLIIGIRFYRRKNKNT